MSADFLEIIFIVKRKKKLIAELNNPIAEE
jgi:hypothetical protein